MMRPTMDQVIDYVRDGEVDRKVADMLRVDPDGDDKLREARFICEMIRSKKAPDLDDDSDMLFGNAALEAPERMIKSASRVQHMHAESLSIVEPPSGEAQIPKIRNMAKGYAESPEELGTLTLQDKKDHTFISFESARKPGDEPGEPLLAASAADKTFYQAGVGEFRSPRGRPDAIRIKGVDCEIALTDRLLPGKPLMLRFSGQGAGSTDVLYMPHEGPFCRTGTDRKGVATLPPDLESGVIRISGHVLQTLRIQRK